jgi:hypothetical protein
LNVKGQKISSVTSRKQGIRKRYMIVLHTKWCLSEAMKTVELSICFWEAQFRRPGIRHASNEVWSFRMWIEAQYVYLNVWSDHKSLYPWKIVSHWKNEKPRWRFNFDADHDRAME